MKLQSLTFRTPMLVPFGSIATHLDGAKWQLELFANAVGLRRDETSWTLYPLNSVESMVVAHSELELNGELDATPSKEPTPAKRRGRPPKDPRILAGGSPMHSPAKDAAKLAEILKASKTVVKV